MISALLYGIFGFIELLLVFRFALRLFAANPANAFVDWVYQASTPLISPFVGVFNQPPIHSSIAMGTFEIATLIALIVYGLIAALITGFLIGPRGQH